MNVCTCIWYNEHVYEFHTMNIQTQFTLREQIIIIDSIKAEPPWETYPPDQLSLPSLCDFTFPTFSVWLYLPYTVCVALPSLHSLCGSTFPTLCGSTFPKFSVWLYLPYTVCVALPSLQSVWLYIPQSVWLYLPYFAHVALPSPQSVWLYIPQSVWLYLPYFAHVALPSLLCPCGSTFPTVCVALPSLQSLCGSTFPTLPIPSLQSVWLYLPYTSTKTAKQPHFRTGLESKCLSERREWLTKKALKKVRGRVWSRG